MSGNKLITMWVAYASEHLSDGDRAVWSGGTYDKFAQLSRDLRGAVERGFVVTVHRQAMTRREYQALGPDERGNCLLKFYGERTIERSCCGDQRVATRG